MSARQNEQEVVAELRHFALVAERNPSPRPTNGNQDPTRQTIPNMARNGRHLCAHLCELRSGAAPARGSKVQFGFRKLENQAAPLQVVGLGFKGLDGGPMNASPLYLGARWRQRAVFSATLLAVTAASAAPKVEVLGPCSDPALSGPVKKLLTQQGYRVTLNDGSTIDLWPRAQLAMAGKAREDATYPLAPSTFAGVIHFEKNTRDYRGNAVAAGTYHLRYELAPNDGDHLGTAPTPDFLLLVPPQADRDPDQSYTFEQLVALSCQVTGKKHPAPFNLVPPDAKEFPSVVTDPEDRTILSFKVKTPSGDLPLALVVRGTTSE
jgi:hypothetical protein